ncbi:MAG: outer membrane assembly protein BamE [Hyphomicrobiales bacterium]|nr:MAG: outer membrane assembly protein BamE [Hyphomicrobiales bacterium]
MVKNSVDAAVLRNRHRRIARAAACGLMFGSAVLLAGCGAGPNVGVGRTFTSGYVLSEDALEQVPVGSSREKVELILGTPSAIGTTSTRTLYYISQMREQKAAFMESEIIDQRVLAVYFDDNDQVREIANYGMQDGKLFDFIGRKTRTGGEDYGFISQILAGAGRINPLGGLNNGGI